MKKSFILMMVVISLITITGCGTTEKKSDATINEKQEKLMSEADRQAGMPAIVNFTERKQMKTILELRDQVGLICYAYLWNEFNGKLIYFGKCIGFGLPYATQYTNPLKYLDDPHGSYEAGSLVIPQSDPNGLFMPASAEATWLMMVNEDDNTVHPVYVEPKVIVSPFKLIK